MRRSGQPKTMADEREKEKRRVPVILLSGFLGVGKTTMLRNLLQNTTKRVACIVNDVASINIDSKLVSNRVTGTTKDLVDTIELQNGCVCCSLRDELFVSLRKLLVRAKRKRKRYDFVVVENSGVAEPSNIRDQFHEASLLHQLLLRRIYLKTMVTVVDSCRFFDEYYSRDTILERPDLGQGGSLPVVDLLIQQVECADLVVLNKSDLMERDGGGESAMGRLQECVHNLNPLAKILVATNGEIPFDDCLLNDDEDKNALMARITNEGMIRGCVSAAASKVRFAPKLSFSKALSADLRWLLCYSQHHHGQGEEGGYHNRYGITSWVYQRRRPFHPERLAEAIREVVPKAPEKGKREGPRPWPTDSHVIRSKGFVWLSSAPSQIFYWSHAHFSFELVPEGEWWDAIPR